MTQEEALLFMADMERRVQDCSTPSGQHQESGSVRLHGLERDLQVLVSPSFVMTLVLVMTLRS